MGLKIYFKLDIHLKLLTLDEYDRHFKFNDEDN